MTAPVTSEVLQRAREIVASTYERMSVDYPDQVHVANYARYTRDGAYDDGREVQIAIAALIDKLPSQRTPIPLDTDLAEIALWNTMA